MVNPPFSWPAGMPSRLSNFSKLSFSRLVLIQWSPSDTHAWGVYHAGYTHYGPITGFHHYGYTTAYRGYPLYGGYRYGGYRYGGYHYGGYHYGAYGYGAYRGGYYRRW
jgi:hypothetical protein